MVKIFEGRRPGLQQIYDALSKQHPDWTHWQIIAEAKAEWHKRNSQ